MSEFRIVLITTSSADDAEKLARSLVEERLAACVNIIPKITSVYRWQGEVKRDGESLLIVKTAARVLDRLRDRVSELHSYDVPEFVAIEPVEISPAYAAFLTSSINMD